MAISTVALNGTESLVEDTRGRVFKRGYHVYGAVHQFEAIAAPNLPKRGDVLSEDASLIVQGVTISQEEGTADTSTGVGRIYKAEVTWGYPTGAIFKPTDQLATWNIGTLTRRVYVDTNGGGVGSRYFHTPTANPWLDQATQTGEFDPDAELGYDQTIPSVELEIKMPQHPTVPWNPVIVAASTGTVSISDFVVGTTVMPAGWVKFLGGTATPVGPTTLDYDITYRFSIAALQIPLGVTLIDPPPGIGPGSALPVKWGVFPLFYPTDVASGYTINREAITGRDLAALVVFQAARESASFNALFGIV